jgi:single-strand DNA-binding protein
MRKYLSKGDKIYVEGRIKSRQWQSEEGVTKYTTEIQVTEFTFLTTKKDTELNKPNASGVPDSIKSSSFDQQNDSQSDDGMPF